MDIYKIIPNIVDFISYDYSKLKCDEYDLLISNILKSCLTSESPKLIQVSGAPGSGKTTFCKKNKYEGFLYISFDTIMTSISSYHNDVKEIGLVSSFEKWEMPARVIGYEILVQAMKKNTNILLEHSGTNEGHIELFKNAKKMGYKTEVIFIYCPLDEIYKRISRREKKGNRHTPLKLIEDRHILVEKYQKQYQQLSDNIKIYNSIKKCFITQI